MLLSGFGVCSHSEYFIGAVVRFFPSLLDIDLYSMTAQQVQPPR